MKPSASESRPPSSLLLRVIHGIFFGGLTAICVVVGWPEWEHLARTQLQPFTAGPPPRAPLLLAVLVVVVSMSVILVRAVRGRSARLRWSLLILIALMLPLWDTYEGPVAGRTADSANLKILLTAKALNSQMVDQLQGHGSIPEDADSWQKVLDQVSKAEPSPVHTRDFAPLPFRVRKVDAPEALPADALPGTLLLYVMAGGVAYELHPVGISPTGTSWPLKASDGEAVVFRGAYNPEVRSPASASPGGGN